MIVPNLPHCPKLAANTAGVLTLATGALVLVGWAFDLSSLKNILPNLVTMKANPALGLAPRGLAVMLVRPEKIARYRWHTQECEREKI